MDEDPYSRPLIQNEFGDNRLWAARYETRVTDSNLIQALSQEIVVCSSGKHFSLLSSPHVFSDTITKQRYILWPADTLVTASKSGVSLFFEYK